MNVGLCLPNFGPLASRDALIDVAVTAEACGFHSLWVGDHLFGMRNIASKYPYSASGRFPIGPEGNWFEAITTLAFLAGKTSRVLLGTSVLILPYRNALVMAKELATLALLSEGRLALGVGTGWMKEEFDALGMDFEYRGARTDETISAMRTLWRDADPRFAGEHIRFSGLAMNPKPPAIPILVGGQSKRAWRRVAQLGDGWLGVGLEPAATREAIGEIRSACAREARDASSVAIVLSRGVIIDDALTSDPRAFHGSLARIRDDAAELRAIGVDHLILFPYREIMSSDRAAMRGVVEGLASTLL
jgi:probable F420-dependent oxidoreductase